MLPAAAERHPFPFQATFPSRAGAASDSPGAARRRNNRHHDDDTAVHSDPEEPSVDVAFELPWSDLREIAGNQNRKALTSGKELTPKLSSSYKKVHT